jgi:hypothetical protein
MVTNSNPLPIIALTSPLNGASYKAPATINLVAGVTANGHTVTKVQFYNGTNLLRELATGPYSFTWSNVLAGSFSLSAKLVYDTSSTLSSTTASVTVTNSNPLPVVALTSPLNGAKYKAPATINLAASVTANGHTVTEVQFYNGTNLIGDSGAAPYAVVLGVLAGSYSLTARLVYDSGSTLSSTPASVTVTNPLPLVLTSPLNSISYKAAATINLAANGHTVTASLLPLANDSVKLSFRGIPTQSYAVLCSTNLDTSWEVLGITTSDDSGLITYVATGKAPARFFRIVLPEP